MAYRSSNADIGSDGNNNVEEKKAISVDAVEDFYSMSHQKRGRAIIFNHKYFAVHQLETRFGTKIDRNKLKKTLKYLGFDVMVYNDLTFKDIMKVVIAESESDHSESDCFVIAVLTHGGDEFLYANDGPYRPENLWTSFTADNCPSLVKKPKIFFIQACRGDLLDAGVILSRTNVDVEIPLATRKEDSATINFRFLSHPDMLIAFSTVPGYYSWRNNKNGSWFIQALCSELKSQGRKLHLLSLLTVVSRRVAIDCESYCPESPSFHKKKQNPCVVSSLTKLLIFPQKSNGGCHSM